MSETPAVPDIGAEWLAAMRRGDWEQAWRATDRIELPRRLQQQSPGFVPAPWHLRWNGTAPAGRVVLVRCEHGLGDTLQFLRFVPRLAARQVVLMVQPPLVELLRGAPGLGQVRDYWSGDALPPHDVDIEVMELAYAVRATCDTLPPPYPHLAGNLPRRDGLVPETPGKLRVGLLWAASGWDDSRSVPLAVLRPLFALSEVRFFSLQQGPAATDPLLDEIGVERLSPRTSDLRDAAAAMLALDLVISIDGMPAHLAGMLGKPTWMLLKHEADWRWMQGREDTPWYPTARLFRQPRAGDWGSVVEKVAQELRRVADERRTIGLR